MNFTNFIPTFITEQWSLMPLYLQNLIVITIQLLAVTICVSLTVAFTTYVERKVIGYMQGRIGTNRVGIKGLCQPVADVIKLLIKEGGKSGLWTNPDGLPEFLKNIF